MEEKIKGWIEKAQTISKEISAFSVSDSHQETDNDSIPYQELKDPAYYRQKALLREHLTEKYTWEEFVNSRKRRGRNHRLRIACYAASVAVVFAAGIMLLRDTSDTGAIHNFHSGTSKAVLVMNNGEEVLLTGHFSKTEEDGTRLETVESGELIYESSATEDGNSGYHTLRIPRGGEYSLVLADGTKVWLNSESELHYPIRFSSEERRVTLKGEGYFEIAHDPGRPFYVNSTSVQVRATGTEFNVSDYADDEDVQVILVEGGVDIEQNGRVLAHLFPDDMFSMDRTTEVFYVQKTDPQAATAWKNGYFFFDDESFGSIIKKLSRWYDVRIVTATPGINDYRFSGKTQKYDSATSILDMLQLTREISYKINSDNSITIYAQ